MSDLKLFRLGIGHFGTGNLEITVASEADFYRAKSLLDRASSEA